MVRRLGMALVIAAVAGSVWAQPPGVALGITPENYPRVDGSTSTLPLARYIMGDVLGLEIARVLTWADTAQIEVVVPDEGADTISEAALQRFRSLRHSNTHWAYMQLMAYHQRLKAKKAGKPAPSADRAPELILVARKPSAHELDLAREVGVEFDVVPVARDAFVFLANKDNPVSTLTVDRVRAIYTGKMPNWSYLGWETAPIRAYQREDDSGSQELLKELVMGDTPAIKAPSMILYGMAGPFNRISQDRYGVGYTVYYYQKFIAAPSKVRVCTLNGVMPNKETIASGQYPLVADVYAVALKSLAPDSPARRLRDWLLTPDGRRTVARSGYVPINPN